MKKATMLADEIVQGYFGLSLTEGYEIWHNAQHECQSKRYAG